MANRHENAFGSTCWPSRACDAAMPVRLGCQHVRDGVATIRTEKTGVTVTIPILPALAATLAAGPCGELAFICGESRKPLAEASFGNTFRDAAALLV
jgi:hypothetical protein